MSSYAKDNFKREAFSFGFNTVLVFGFLFLALNFMKTNMMLSAAQLFMIYIVSREIREDVKGLSELWPRYKEYKRLSGLVSDIEVFMATGVLRLRQLAKFGNFNYHDISKEATFNTEFGTIRVNKMEFYKGYEVVFRSIGSMNFETLEIVSEKEYENRNDAVWWVLHCYIKILKQKIKRDI